MRLLNPFFSRSKREQDKPIRDKLKGKKYFEKMLSIKLGEIADDEKYIQKERNSNDGIVRPFFILVLCCGSYTGNRNKLLYG